MYENEVCMITLPKPLSQEEQMELAIRYRGGDIEAGKLLIETNLRFLQRSAQRYRWANIPQEDLFQAAAEGLCVGLSKYDPSYNTAFLTYARKWAKSYVLKLINKQSAPVRVGDTRASRRIIGALTRSINDIEERGEEATSKTIAKEIGDVSREEVEATMQILASRRGPSIYGHREEGLRIIDTIEGEARDLDVRVDVKALSKRLEDFANTHLKDKREEVIWEECIIKKGMGKTYVQLGKEFDVSKARIGQIKEVILKRLHETTDLSAYMQ